MTAVLARLRSANRGSGPTPRHFNNLVTNFAPNAGTRITACPIPVCPAAATRENFQFMQPLAPPRLATKRILIVEDNALNMKLLRDVLEAFGYETITTGEGMEGVALACEQRPDLILMDIQLPDISGYDAVRRLKDHPPTQTIPVVAVTAFAMSGDESKALLSGCDAYVAKPIALRDFIEVVERFIGGAGAPR